MKGHTDTMEKRKQLIDLHMHTTNSDGEETPEILVERAKEAGLSLIAITDHNRFTFTECKQFEGMMIVPGIEFSAEYHVPERKDSTEIHIVGIFPNGVDISDFDDIFASIGDGKKAYVAAILEDLKTRGIHITMDEVYGVERNCEHIGRHQIARILVDRNIEPDIDAAFDHQIGNFSPYYIPSTRFIHYASMDTLVKKVRACGGIPCLAHPYGYMLNETEIEQLVQDFKQAAGAVAGMEVYYEIYLTDLKRMDFLKKMQKKYELLASCGSDRHRPDQPFASCGDIKLFEDMINALNNNPTV